MDKAFLAVCVTLAAAFLGFRLGDWINLPEVGTVIAVAVMGGFIIYFNESKK